MALHRDIYWVGRQWAVTGYGIQACDQKQKGQFDIEGSRLWEEGVQERLRAQKWLNAEDFDKAVAVARKHFPEPSPNVEPQPVAVSPREEGLGPAKSPRPADEAPQARKRGLSARFIPVWRIRAHLSVPGKGR
jgi:hypothetical protein